MNSYFGSAEAAKVGIIQVAKAPVNRYDYTLPVNCFRNINKILCSEHQNKPGAGLKMHQNGDILMVKNFVCMSPIVLDYVSSFLELDFD